MTIHWFFLIPLFLCLGSFFNVMAYRILAEKSFLRGRSRCPQCKSKLMWHDLIPVISFIALGGRCRFCHHRISWLYPFIELAAVITFSCMILFVDSHYWLAYGLFFSVLLINTRTDLQEMVIPSATSLYLVPIGWICAFTKLIPLTPLQSIFGSFAGYLILFSIAKIFYFITKKDGLGEGDFDLLALVGAFTGINGVFASLFYGSIGGSIIGIFLMIFGNYSKNSKLPFGPFLALGALVHIFNPFLLTRLLI
ncbi:MAG: Type 4 prepilin-like protein leader peptide-processing enzyme [candidate division TM6 bacterium GW2011_GWE2_36_25]|nr:MAG: Type 4 prepilin-like protein leader peptide-processing enzyme [candidate division TM6 bacterium GW2011_GWF2_36_131]KKQ03458.1 MAG: Type 4 prepilin-like protein leader peptide-processing enzyme [candidate division TM6 bacterium GW2011_GWE2_36_25]KKQ20268.1 MAG: Type 4 prepilin-like protein leader peptide-processing enzyme [candidate division TM6 bacterium GW2011_GWA2_36_9]